MDKDHIEGSKPVIADEMKELFDQIRNDLALMRADLALINYDVMQIREQLDRIEKRNIAAQQEPIGLAPNTPPPDFLPPEMM